MFQSLIKEHTGYCAFFGLGEIDFFGLGVAFRKTESDARRKCEERECNILVALRERKDGKTFDKRQGLYGSKIITLIPTSDGGLVETVKKTY